jgi:osmotically-inducible protein OsmY
MRLATFGFVLLLATLAFAQQQAQPPPSATPPTFPDVPQMPPDQKAPPPQRLSTQEIQQQIQEHFNSEPTLANTNLAVQADESSVVLTGTVDSDVQRDLALRIVQSYAGDRKLVDRVKVPQ